jgi:alginate O-acetyltransferase complex protein AlgI
MLFNSVPFLFAFFPLTVVVFFVLGFRSPLLAGLWLSGASLFFYAWWNATFVALLLTSVIFNYCAGCLIGGQFGNIEGRYRRVMLVFAVAADLLLLAYFKYAGFFANIAREIFGWAPNFGHIVLPLGISFFTFTQVAFLVDTYQRKAKEFNFLHYVLFVTYFPHLIAGPIFHHGQIMPQFADRRTYRIDWTHVYVGMTVFVIGLFKKIFVADHFGAIATPIFSDAQQGVTHLMIVAWAGALAYTLQLYFDFSGYSDMAIGLSLFFNVKIPLNFNSPYKALSIIDFWRRWHMTLSAFLRDYLYIPLGGNRKGKVLRYFNLFATMLLGGLWHGAGWTFVVWGGLHGVYLIANHGFRALRSRMGWRNRFGLAGELARGAITFISVVIAWVFFRADSFSAASTMLHGMVGSTGFGLLHPSNFTEVSAITLSGRIILASIGIGLIAVWVLPNTQEFMRAFHPAYESVAQPRGFAARLTWQPARWWTWSSVGILLALLILSMSPAHVSEFLYYQF